MKISMTYGSFKIKIRLPYCIALNYFTAISVSSKLKKAEICVTAKNVYSSFKSLKKGIRKNKKLTVFSMNTVSGFEMYITL